jgi:hypothetical protein
MYTNHCHRVFTQLQLTNISIKEFGAYSPLGTKAINRTPATEFWEIFVDEY